MNDSASADAPAPAPGPAPTPAPTPAGNRDNIEQLYKYYGILADAKEHVKQHSDIYEKILKATKGSANEKKLACQFIPRFFAHFPQLADEAINAHFDLCEDSDLSIRKQAIKELPYFCRECTEYTRRVADILAQLLQAPEPTELTVVRNALLSLFKIEPKAALLGIFNQIRNGEDKVREKCIDFVLTRVKELPAEIFTRDVQEVFTAEIKSVLQDASHDEIQIFFDLLIWTSLGKNIEGKKQILDIVIQHLEAEKSLNSDDECFIDRVLTFVKTAKSLFSAEVNSNQFLVYFCEEVVPKFNSIPGCNEGSGNALEVLKLLADIACYVKDLKNTSGVLDAVFSLLLEYLPLPTEEEGIPYQKLQFTYVECLLSTMHHLLKENPEYLLHGEKEKLKDLRMRLQYFARASQIYVKTLDEVVKKNKNEDLDNMDSRIKLMALKTISNINMLIKDFFHNPPAYRANIQLSWMSVTKQPQKRKPSSEIRVEKPVKQSRAFHQEIYQPPNGKYSSSLFGAR